MQVNPNVNPSQNINPRKIAAQIKAMPASSLKVSSNGVLKAKLNLKG